MLTWTAIAQILYSLIINFTLLFQLDVMVLNDIIEQAAGRHSRASDHGGKCSLVLATDAHDELNIGYANR